MSRLRAYAQLIRLPNLPTALADICLAALALAMQPPVGDLEAGFPVGRLVLLMLASVCLYSSGMVWNDYFDQEQDSRERPFRPLPSGRVTPAEAARLGGVLMAAGTGLAFLASATAFTIALLLVAAILLYDRFLKRGWAGPLGMGLCRFLNVLLGLSLAGTIPSPWGWHLAFIVGLYIVGVTWLARTEARLSQKAALQGAAVVLLASLALALPLPVQAAQKAASPLFPYLLVVLAFLIGFPVSRAIASPTPTCVQAAVKRCLMGLILLDAVLATALAGTVGLLLLLLLVPVLLLRRMRWLYAT
jgi:4-hydroxybenzoate polyprenyltransferase